MFNNSETAMHIKNLQISLIEDMNMDGSIYNYVENEKIIFDYYI